MKVNNFGLGLGITPLLSNKPTVREQGGEASKSSETQAFVWEDITGSN